MKRIYLLILAINLKIFGASVNTAHELVGWQNDVDIQYYVVNKIKDTIWPEAKDGVVGIDQFIGKPEYLGKGYGTLLIKKFIEEILKPQTFITKIIVDVDPKNLRAIKCYEKVGFKQYTSPHAQFNVLFMTYDLSKD